MGGSRNRVLRLLGTIHAFQAAGVNREKALRNAAPSPRRLYSPRAAPSAGVGRRFHVSFPDSEVLEDASSTATVDANGRMLRAQVHAKAREFRALDAVHPHDDPLAIEARDVQTLGCHATARGHETPRPRVASWTQTIALSRSLPPPGPHSTLCSQSPAGRAINPAGQARRYPRSKRAGARPTLPDPLAKSCSRRLANRYAARW